jgi:FdhD protein
MPQSRPTSTRSSPVEVWKSGRGAFEDRVVTEEPLEIRLDGHPHAITLRTPGDDDELAAGFVLTEGLVVSVDEIEAIVALEDVAPSSRGNVVDVRLAPQAGRRAVLSARRPARPSFITSACGICGRGTIDAVARRTAPLASGPKLGAHVLAPLPDRLREVQAVFAETGGLHAAGLFTADGRLVVAREDVGRHNAVDKVIGYGALRGLLPYSDAVLVVSGRAGFEIVQKAWIAGIPIVASISASTQLGVELAEEANMTLIGFLRDGRFTIYTGRERVHAE